ncbi:MAG: phage head morphogenesis protein [Endozoicomonas sp.]
MAVKVYNFFELSEVFTLKPQEAIEHFQSKGLSASFSWLDMIGEENDAAFTVAKMMDTDLLSYVDKQVDKVIDEGLTLADFRKELIPRLHNRFGSDRLKPVLPPSIAAENLYSGEIDRKGIALWGISWEQSIIR